MTDTLKTFDKVRRGVTASMAAIAISFAASAQQYDPDCVVEQWEDVTTSDKIIDINFSDADMPNTWKSKSGIYTPDTQRAATPTAALRWPHGPMGRKQT